MDGSSSKSVSGFDISALPTASICCSPPESVPASCCLRSNRRGNSSKIHSRVRSLRSLSRMQKAPRRRFSSTLMVPKTRRPSGDWAMPRFTTSWLGYLSRGLPSKMISPSQGRTRPLMDSRVVLLPAPLAPRMVTISPSSTCRSIPCSTSTLP